LDEGGLTIEGIAVQERRLYVGFRAPSLSADQAVVLSVALGALFDREAPNSRLHLLHLGTGRGVRDLAAHATGFLVLAGPSGEEAGRYSIFWWDGEVQTTLLKDLPVFRDEEGKVLKPESVLPLTPFGAPRRALILFDGAKEGSPRAIETE
jgi:Protein of unknown function (DUF3616)